MQLVKAGALSLLLGITLFACSSCRQANLEAPPNIVWITSEDNSKHFLSLFDEHGASTPNIAFLASQGIRFTHAFSNAPVCSVARSTLISSCYAPRIGAQYHRKSSEVPMPDSLDMFPAYLKAAGYYTSNNAKEDYNIQKSDSVWDESSRSASWRNRKAAQPFFHVQNFLVTHESRLHFSGEQMVSEQTETDPATVFIPPVHPQTELFRYSYARYHDRIREMDQQVGEVIDALREDNLLDDTFIFYFSDHGGVLPGSKGYLKEAGLHVPLVVYVPKNYRHLVPSAPGATIDGFVSFVDFGATVLNLAGVEVPAKMDGVPFLGKKISTRELDKRNVSFGYADRFDEKYDMVRTLRIGNYKYVRNFQPFNIDALQNNYRYRMLAYEEWRALYWQGALNEKQSGFFRPKAVEELYDLETDPYELKNLAEVPEFKSKLIRMRAEMGERMIRMPDLGFYPEYYFLEYGLHNPEQFGIDHRGEIQALKEIADLQLVPFEHARDHIVQGLNADQAMERYWSLIVCTTFGREAGELTPLIEQISLEDPERINRVRAAEYLALTGHADPAPVITDALRESENLPECWLMLNTVALLKDIRSPYAFEIDEEIFSRQFLEDRNIRERMLYINGNSDID